jgi:hypothetical protein
MPGISYLCEHVSYLLAQARKAEEAGNVELSKYFVAMAIRRDDAANEIEKAAKPKERIDRLGLRPPPS